MNKRTKDFFCFGGKQTQNPCRPWGCPSDFPIPDPFVLRFLGTYYCYATADSGVSVFTSRDLVNWEYHGFALESEGEHGFWAPSVIYRNGRFYMYYSSCCGEEFEWMRVASAQQPLGPFHFEKALSSCFSIDTHAVRGRDGRYYLFYCTDNACGNSLTRPGTSVLVDRLLDPVTLEGRPRLVLKPTIDQEISGKNAVSAGRDWYTVEGAFYLRHGKEEYLMYSGNSFEREDYFIGYARSVRENGQGNEVWQKCPGESIYAPFCRKTDLAGGTGHNSVTKAPNLVDDWCVYHARLNKAGEKGGECRLMFTDRILWDRQEMWLAGPTVEKRDAPAGPGFSDFFEKDLNRWESISGRWKAEEKRAVQEDASVPARLRWKGRCRDFVMEVWVRTKLQPHGSLLGAGLYGNRESLQFLLHEGLRRAEVIRWENGVRLQEKTVPLEEGYAPFSWHCIRLEKRGKQVRFLLDDFEMAEVPCSHDETVPELYTQLCCGEFAAFSLTACVKAEGERLAELISCETDSGIFEGSIRGISYFTADHGEGKLILPSLPGSGYEAALDIYPEGGRGRAWWKLEISENTAVEILLEEGYFLTNGGRLLISPLEGHTLRVKVRNGKAAVLLDRHCIYSGVLEGNPCLALRVNDCVRITGLEAVGWGPVPLQ